MRVHKVTDGCREILAECEADARDLAESLADDASEWLDAAEIAHAMADYPVLERDYREDADEMEGEFPW